MRVLNIYILLLFIGLGLSCSKKKYPEPEIFENSAVYYSKVTVDNVPLTLEAGVNGYYMYSSYTLDSNSIYNFIANLKPANCADCPNSLQIQLNDYTTSQYASSFLADSSLRTGNYSYLPPNPETAYSVKFHPVTPADSYYWEFGDGTSSTSMNPVKVFNREGKYNVCLRITKGQCGNTICNKEKINVADNSCKTSISAVADSGNSISFDNTTVKGKGPYQYLWNFGDGSLSTDGAVVHTYKNRGAYSVSLRVVDLYGDTAYANYNAKTKNDVSSCTANYYTTNLIKLPNAEIFSRILINWTDASGTVYSSRQGLQPSDSYFQIISVSDNQVNEKNQPTKKIRAKFKCKVFNGVKMITLDDAEVNICVAHN